MTVSTFELAAADEAHRAESIIQRERVAIDLAGAELAAMPLMNPATLPAVSIFRIRYESEGIPVSGFLFFPPTEGPHPAVIFNRGGFGEFGMLRPDLAFLQLADLAAEGFVVAASQYRGTGGAPGRDEFGGADVADVLALIDVLDGMEEVDPERIGMMGHSRGGMMTWLALARTGRIKAAAILAGPTDLPGGLVARPEMMEVYSRAISADRARVIAGLEERSALRFADALPRETPILLIHGTADWRVSPTDSLRMAEQLLDLRIPFRLVLLEGAEHGFSEHRLEVQRMVRDWFARFLAEDPELPEVSPHGP